MAKDTSLNTSQSELVDAASKPNRESMWSDSIDFELFEHFRFSISPSGIWLNTSFQLLLGINGGLQTRLISEGGYRRVVDCRIPQYIKSDLSQTITNNRYLDSGVFLCKKLASMFSGKNGGKNAKTHK